MPLPAETPNWSWFRCGWRYGSAPRKATTPNPVLQQPIELAQYTSIRFTEHLEIEGIKPSIGSVGDAFDNALMECVIGLYKTECIRTTVFHDEPFRTVTDVEFATAGWVAW